MNPQQLETVPPPANDADALRHEIEVTRAELGQTVEELAARSGVAARRFGVIAGCVLAGVAAVWLVTRRGASTG